MITSSPFSFVRFEHPAPNDYSLDIPYSLPVFDEHRLAFYFRVSGARPVTDKIFLGMATEDGEFLRSLGVEATPRGLRFDLSPWLTPPLLLLTSIVLNGSTYLYSGSIGQAQFRSILRDDLGLVLEGSGVSLPAGSTLEIHVIGIAGSEPESSWGEGYVKIEGVPLLWEGCFCYALLDEENNVLGYSNLFKPVDEAAFTSLLQYNCEGPAFEFGYFEGGKNIIRLPVYLLKPDWPTKRTVYRQSNGRSQLTSATIAKQYALETDHMPEVFHECLRVALVHDSVILECPNIREGTVAVIESEDYKVQWNDDIRVLYAPAKGSLMVATFGYANSNC